MVRLLFRFKASANAWRPEQAGHMNASEGLKSTAALAPSPTISLSLRSIVVRLLFRFKASASAWPGRAGRPHECKRGSQGHGSLGTIITDAIHAEVDRGEAAALLQRLCQRLGARPNSTAGQVASFPDSAELVGASATAVPSEPSASLIIWMSSKVFSEAKACRKGAWGWREIR